MLKRHTQNKKKYESKRNERKVAVACKINEKRCKILKRKKDGEWGFVSM